VLSKTGVAKQSLDAFDYVLMVDRELHTCNSDILTYERWATGQLFVDDLVKILSISVREIELLSDLQVGVSTK
jgi:hypothetical protein